MGNVVDTPDDEGIGDTVETGDVRVCEKPSGPFLVDAPDDAPLDDCGEWTGEESSGWWVESADLIDAVDALTDAGYTVSLDERAVKIAERAGGGSP